MLSQILLYVLSSLAFMLLPDLAFYSTSDNVVPPVENFMAYRMAPIPINMLFKVIFYCDLVNQYPTTLSFYSCAHFPRHLCALLVLPQTCPRF